MCRSVAESLRSMARRRRTRDGFVVEFELSWTHDEDKLTDDILEMYPVSSAFHAEQPHES